MNQPLEGSERRWTREEVEKTLNGILTESLGVEEKKIVPGASLVHDLGAESIDFLDIGFRVQQIFGVEVPIKAIQEKTLRWRDLGEFRTIVKEKLGIDVGQDELRQFHTMGIQEVLEQLVTKMGAKLQDGEAERVAASLADRLAGEIESIGFRAALVDRKAIVRMLSKNLSSPQIMEGMIQLFTVGILADFIASRVVSGLDGSKGERDMNR
jgi:acyl carrier protein